MSSSPDPLPPAIIKRSISERLVAVLERIAAALEHGGAIVEVASVEREGTKRHCAYAPCAKPFRPRGPRQRFCSTTCRVYAFEMKNGGRDASGKRVQQ